MVGKFSLQRIHGTSFAAEAADWIEEKWGVLPIVESLRASAQTGGIGQSDLPITYGQVEGGELIATVSILTDDLVGYQELNPWIGCLIVRPGRRREGLGGKMLKYAETSCRKLGFDVIYLFTEPHLTTFYAQRGWEGLQWATDQGHPVLIMTKSTG